MNVLAELFLAIARSMDLKGTGIVRHSERVAVIAYFLGKELAPLQAGELLYAGLLHDIGAIQATDHITSFITLESQLTDNVVSSHPVVGATLVRQYVRHHFLADVILEHHERWDGRGYPQGKKSDEISLGGQIIRLADALDFALRLPQAGEKPLAKVLAPQEVGQEFSPELYQGLLHALGEENLYQQLKDDEQLPPLSQQVLETVPPPLQLSEADLDNVLLFFARLADSKRSYPLRHNEQVSLYSAELSQGLGLPPDVVQGVRRAALFHDIGILGVPRKILEAERELTPEERQLIQRHPVLTALVMSQVTPLRELALMAGYHHARYDGKGYPQGLAGEDIPLGARIITVADAFDALTQPSPYRKGILTSPEALKVLQENSGSQFCPRVVEAAGKVFGR